MAKERHSLWVESSIVAIIKDYQKENDIGSFNRAVEFLILEWASGGTGQRAKSRGAPRKEKSVPTNTRAKAREDMYEF